MSISPTDVRRAAMDLLARREHSAGELCEKLLRRFNKALRAQKSSQSFFKDPFKDPSKDPSISSTKNASRKNSRRFGANRPSNDDADLGFHTDNDSGFDSDRETNPAIDFESEPETEPELSAEQLRALIQVEVDKLTGSGLQSDARLAEAFIRSRVNRGQGPMKIKMELRQKGLNDSLIEQAMAEAQVDWQSLAIDVATRKFAREDFGGKDSNLTTKLRAKRQRFLQQRGFSFEQISAVERE